MADIAAEGAEKPAWSRLRILAAIYVVVAGLFLAGTIAGLDANLLGYAAVAIMFATAVAVLVIALVVERLDKAVAEARQLGGYELVEMLGKGGMGEVWRARHETLIRPAAVKLLRSELSGSLSKFELVALNLRFQREVQTTATLTSPHTVEVFDFGQTADGTLYYVMELLNGLDAETLVRTYGPQPAERVIHLMRHICESLEEAHHRKLIHRDIKPANIFVCSIGMEVDFVKVLDFGLVRDLNTESRLTMQGSTPGTPAYLAPEFVLDRVDHRADLYSLGCVAYFLLTGSVVFEATTRVAMMAAHSQNTPVAPSKRTELQIPAELDALVLALLAKKPDDRPQTAQDLARRLAAIPLQTPWTADRAEAWWRVHLPAMLAKGRSGADPADHAIATRRLQPVIRDRTRPT